MLDREEVEDEELEGDEQQQQEDEEMEAFIEGDEEEDEEEEEVRDSASCGGTGGMMAGLGCAHIACTFGGAGVACYVVCAVVFLRHVSAALKTTTEAVNEAAPEPSCIAVLHTCGPLGTPSVNC